MSKLHLPFKLGIRGKLLVVSTLAFTTVFVVHGLLAGYTLTRSSQQLELDTLHQNITDTLVLVAQSIQASDVKAAIASQDDSTPEYDRVIGPLEDLVDNNPQVDEAYIYVYDSAKNQEMQVAYVCSQRTQAKQCDGDSETTFGDFAPIEDWEKPIFDRFSQPAARPDVYLDPQPSEDDLGLYTSGYAPIRDANGQMVAYIGVDMRAQQLADIIAVVRDTSIKSFFIIYPFVLLIMFLVASALTKPLRNFSGVARLLAKGEPYKPEYLSKEITLPDERGELARVFDKMAQEVQARETKLKQEVVQLKIEIDHAKKQQAVEEITESNFFTELQAKARALREPEQPAAGKSGESADVPKPE